jgi:hypothetical protein
MGMVSCSAGGGWAHQRRRAADHRSGWVILRPVAGAHELVLRVVPGNHTAQVRAYGVEPIRTQAAVFGDNQVGRVSLQAVTGSALAALLSGQAPSAMTMPAARRPWKIFWWTWRTFSP